MPPDSRRASPFAARVNHLRARGGHEDSRVTYVELFFDLVFVFAVTQLSHGLLEHLTPLGAMQTAVLMLAVWWAWIDTAWITNWLDPGSHRGPADAVRADAGRARSGGVDPEGVRRSRAAVRARLRVGQVGRSLFMLWALKNHDAGNFRNFIRIIVWQARSALLWIAGALARRPGPADVVGDRGRHRNRRRRCSASGCRCSAARPPPTGRSKAATWPSAARCSSSSRSANRCWSPARPLPASPGPPSTSARSSSPSPAASRCG